MLTRINGGTQSIDWIMGTSLDSNYVVASLDYLSGGILAAGLSYSYTGTDSGIFL